ncbi:tyrosine-type recombinase/integrase [Lysinibacillus sphaericus]|uniref:site-specific integrase n=1 Tax=Lysinibacillus sphaericus TaxID=1421 RepID=UPI00248B1CF1|nr:tyrosine-type recombinase/integrase [Lysinibacillus sphaericus]
MASFTKRGKTWQYTVSHYIDGKPSHIRKGGFRTKPEAMAAAKEVEYQLSKGHVAITRNTSFSEYFKNWVELYKVGKHKTTYTRYMNSVDRVKEYFKDMPIQKITSNQYQKFLNDYGIGKSRETVRKLNTHIRSCVRDAIEEGYISVDFTRKAEFNATKSAKKSEEKHLNFDESMKLYETLLNKASKESMSSYLLLLGLVSGLRFGELVGLTIDKFDFETNTLKVERAWDYKDGTGFGPLKNEQSKRIISIDNIVMSKFEALFNEMPDHPYDLVFYSRVSKVSVLSNEGVNKALKNILGQLDIKPISVHGLRHTHASILLYQGASINSVSERLGHSDIQTTQDHYSHVLKEMKERDEKIAVNMFKKNMDNSV